MEEFSDLIKVLELDDSNEPTVSYEFIEVFKNPNKLPINQIHLEKVTLKLPKDFNSNTLGKADGNLESKHFERKVTVVPALDKSWLPESLPIFKYQPYNFAATEEENYLFIRNNHLFLQTLDYLLRCNYHQFWCLMLFEPQVAVSLHSFLLNPILAHEIVELDDEYTSIYEAVFTHFYLVYRRLLIYKASETEYMAEDVWLNYLLDKKLVNLPIVLTLTLLYQQTDMEFINNLVSLYFVEESVFRDKEIEEMLNQVLLTLDMIGGHICGFESGAVIVPIAIEERPLVFSLSWVYSVVSYLLCTISTLGILLKYYKPSVGVAINKGIPYRLSFTYERVYFNLYDYLEGRTELEENSDLADLVFEEMALGRCEFIEVYNTFISYCLDKTLELSGNPIQQEEMVETYLKLMTTALEDEYFICDYHERYDVGVQNEMFTSCAELDETRTDYILTCITSLRRHNRIWKALKSDSKALKKAKKKYGIARKKELDLLQENYEEPLPGPSTDSQDLNFNPSEEETENSVQVVLDMFPHLGDGFVVKCLEAYNYQPSEVISAILEENLPPHILDIPFDLIRIPPEPKPAEPILAYRGKKPGYDDALKLLNDKRDMKQIKTFVLDGIQYSNDYDVYDDEYDDRVDEETVNVRDYGSEDVLKFNPNYEDVVSDTSYSENEYDEKGEPMEARSATTNDKSKGKGAFCEDPALLRAQREARWKSQGKSRDLVGKPKGQGQDKTVEKNRQKKNVNKSSRANHNRKSGAQWKRNKGMLPS